MTKYEVRVRWPKQPTARRGTASLRLEEDYGTWTGTPINLVLRTSSVSADGGTLRVDYPEGATGSGVLALWWKEEDGCTNHLLGYYKDGGFTTELDEATRVEFTGESEDASGPFPRIPGTYRAWANAAAAIVQEPTNTRLTRYPPLDTLLVYAHPNATPTGSSAQRTASFSPGPQAGSPQMGHPAVRWIAVESPVRLDIFNRPAPLGPFPLDGGRLEPAPYSIRGWG